MTDKKAIQLAKRVEFWQKQLSGLGVGHWRIEQVSCVNEVPGAQGSLAGVFPSGQYASATFWFQNEHIDNSTPREVDETIVHEWLHVVMRDLDAALDSVDEHLAPAVEEMWKSRVTHEREALVDMLARDIVDKYYAAKQ